MNVSGWKDIDKEGKHYRDYFTNASGYTITNYKAEARGFQGMDNEVFLDLESDLPEQMQGKFDVVFNHTTLEHIYDIHKAFSNLCALSNDVVILVLPFVQQYHSDYGDYWRLTPLAIKRLFEDNGLSLVYQSFNNDKASSVYTFSIASKQPAKWEHHFDWTFTCEDPSSHTHEPYIGCNAIENSGIRLKKRIKSLFKQSKKKNRNKR